MKITKLINNDCFKEIKNIPDNSVDLIITDPPYKLQEGAGKFRNARSYGKEIHSMINGFDYKLLDEMLRVLKTVNVYMFCSHDQVLDLIDYFVRKHGCKWELITWHKTNPIPVCNNTYLHDTEYCLFFRDKETKVNGNYHTKHTYFTSPINKKDKKKYGHPTVKPLEMVKNFIINSSNENEVILDPFMGSGTTGEAAKLCNREFIGIELDNTYFETAKNRIENTKEKE